MNDTTCSMICTPDSFQPCDIADIKWLDWTEDYDLAWTYWSSTRVLGREEWDKIWGEARDEGYRYCALTQANAIVSIAAVWMYSDTAWEVAAVRTIPTHQKRGYARALVSFTTRHILESGRMATCTIRSDNAAMLRAAGRVGFQRRKVSG